MNNSKLEINGELKIKLQEMRNQLSGITILDDDSTSKIWGGCGGVCHVTCSWWCEDECMESCAFTSQAIAGMLGDFCAHKPVYDPEADEYVFYY